MARITFITSGIILSLLLSGCSKAKDAPVETVRPVQLAEVKRDSIQRVITADGILRALDQSAITPKISAPVSKFFVNRGDHVKKGQLLAVLENRDLAASVVDAKGAYDQVSATYRNVASASVPDEITKAQADVQSTKQTMDAAQKLLQNREQLFRDGALARKQVDEAAVAYAQAKSQYETSLKHLESVQSVSRLEEVKSAQGQVDSAKGKYEAAEAQLAYSEIHSPIDGVVADRAVFPGEMAAAGTPILTVMDVSSVIARVNIPQTQAVYVKVGQPAKIASTDGSVEVNGKVTVVSPALDPQATTVEVWVQAANPGEKLRPGGTVHVTITADTIKNAIVVPPAALLPSSEGGTAVLVVGNDMVAHEHKVQVGLRTADKVQILDGVDEGAKVVIAGGLGLEDGAKVKLQEAPDKKDADKKDEDKEKK